MSAATFASSASSVNLSYGQNVGRAARALLAALLAIPSRSNAAVAEKTMSERERRESVFGLYRLASTYDSVMPNLAQELRAIANRN